MSLALMVHKFLDKKLLVFLLKMRTCPTSNWQKNYTNPLLESSRRKKVHSIFRNNNWDADLADLQ